MSRPAARPVLGVVTIGRTPRPDLASTFGAAAPHAEVRVAGALDGLSHVDVGSLCAPGPYPLLVRLGGGDVAEVPRDRLLPHVVRVACDLAAAGASLVVLACAGEFPSVPCPVPVLIPGRVVPAAMRALAPGGRLGIVTPNAAQVPFAEEKWRQDGFDVVVTSAAPGRHDDLITAAVALEQAGVSVIVLDCMGHDEADRAVVAARCRCPVVAAQPLVAHLAAAMV